MDRTTRGTERRGRGGRKAPSDVKYLCLFRARLLVPRANYAIVFATISLVFGVSFRVITLSEVADRGNHDRQEMNRFIYEATWRCFLSPCHATSTLPSPTPPLPPSLTQFPLSLPRSFTNNFMIRDSQGTHPRTMVRSAPLQAALGRLLNSVFLIRFLYICNLE